MMLLKTALEEFQSIWLPHASTSGLERIRDLLASASPFLIHGSFAKACPMGCVATHLAWHHPRTEHLHEEAGIRWLTKVAGLNPGTSQFIQYWDQHPDGHSWSFRQKLIELVEDEIVRRAELFPSASEEFACFAE